MFSDDRKNWDRFIEQIRRVKNLDQSEITAGSIMTNFGVELSNTPEEAIRKGRLESVKRGEPLKISSNDKINDIDNELAEDFADDLIKNIFKL